jgi:MoxR-like ATPase
LELRQDRLDALRKAIAELEAEASADHARRREQQARAAEEQAAEAAAQVADAEAATAVADNDKGDAESEAAAQALAKEAQQAERRARSARGRAELARKLAIEKAQAADLSIPDPLISVDPLAMPSRNLPTNAAGDPKGNAQRNFTDPDSHILKGGDGWIQGYNCQAAVDGDHQIIVAVGVSNQASDAPHLEPMLERIVANTGQLPKAMITDAGYCSTANIEASEKRGLDA